MEGTSKEQENNVVILVWDKSLPYGRGKLIKEKRNKIDIYFN